MLNLNVRREKKKGEGAIKKNRLSKGECKNRKEDRDRRGGSRSARMGDQHGLVK